MKTKCLLIMIVLSLIFFTGCVEEKDCYSEKYKVDLCQPQNRAFRPVAIKDSAPKEREEYEFVAENEEFRQTGFRAIVVRPRKGGIPQLALLNGHDYYDFSNKNNYRILLHGVSYWRNASQVDTFLVAEISMLPIRK